MESSAPVDAQKCSGARKDEDLSRGVLFLYVEVQVRRPDAADGRFSASTKGLFFSPLRSFEVQQLPGEGVEVSYFSFGLQPDHERGTFHCVLLFAVFLSDYEVPYICHWRSL